MWITTPTSRVRTPADTRSTCFSIRVPPSTFIRFIHSTDSRRAWSGVSALHVLNRSISARLRRFTICFLEALVPVSRRVHFSVYRFHYPAFSAAHCPGITRGGGWRTVSTLFPNPSEARGAKGDGEPDPDRGFEERTPEIIKRMFVVREINSNTEGILREYQSMFAGSKGVVIADLHENEG